MYSIRGRGTDNSPAARRYQMNRPRRFLSLRGRYANQRLLYSSLSGLKFNSPMDPSIPSNYPSKSESSNVNLKLAGRKRSRNIRLFANLFYLIDWFFIGYVFLTKHSLISLDWKLIVVYLLFIYYWIIKMM